MSEAEYQQLHTAMRGLWMRAGEIPAFAEQVRASSLSATELSQLLDAVPPLRTGTSGDACAKLHDILSRAHQERLAATASAPNFDATGATLAKEIAQQKDVMIAVATGGPRIETVNGEYQERQHSIRTGLAAVGLTDPNPFDDLWQWYGRWSSGDMPRYRDRREYVAALYRPLLEQLANPTRTPMPPTGWEAVDRQRDKVDAQLARARYPEDFQQVGLLCREALISLAQAVFDPAMHQTEDGVDASDTDAKRRLAGYIMHELRGSSNEKQRRHAKAALDLAVELQHRRSADFRNAALCAEATHSVVNLLAIVSGRRDPEAMP